MAITTAVFSTLESLITTLETSAHTNAHTRAVQEQVTTLTTTVHSLQQAMLDQQTTFQDERLALQSCVQEAEQNRLQQATLEQTTAQDTVAIQHAIDDAMSKVHDRLTSTELTLEVTMNALELAQQKTQRLEHKCSTMQQQHTEQRTAWASRNGDLTFTVEARTKQVAALSMQLRSPTMRRS